MSAREIAVRYVRDVVCDRPRAEWIVSLIEAADAVDLDEYGDEIHWIILRIGKHTAAWNDLDGWDCSEAAIEMATLAERKRIIAKLRERQRAASARWHAAEARGSAGHIPGTIAGAHEFAYGSIADELEAESQP